ncbi:MAG: hypothetical protein IOD12_10525 [Silvanigrellales bacterium]|jgi:phosphate acetyltransferase|nr:hypothetical protein [Silvanigrellales bacterium]
MTPVLSLLSEMPAGTRERLFARARGRRVALPETDDIRIREAAEVLSAHFGVACLLPTPEFLEAHRTLVSDRLREVATLRGKDPAKVPQGMEADAFYLCGTLLARGDVDAVVGGAVASTAHVLRAALSTVGLRSGTSLVSSAFLMALREPTPGGEPLLVFSDGAVNPQPTAAQLSDIAKLAADAFFAWTGNEPRIAFLSFSTKGSAEHPDVTKVRDAFALFVKRCPDVKATGEVQLDTALVPSVAVRKDAEGSLAGNANVLVFPDLDAGNIGYKLTQRLAGAGAYGPILLGVARPFSDLSRGASSLDVVATTLLTLSLEDPAK